MLSRCYLWRGTLALVSSDPVAQSADATANSYQPPAAEGAYFCTHCGGEVEQSAVVCPHCGGSVEEVVDAPATDDDDLAAVAARLKPAGSGARRLAGGLFFLDVGLEMMHVSGAATAEGGPPPSLLRTFFTLAVAAALVLGRDGVRGLAIFMVAVSTFVTVPPLALQGAWLGAALVAGHYGGLLLLLVGRAPGPWRTAAGAALHLLTLAILFA